MSNIKFTAARLASKGKLGILKPDSNGYYELVIGGLNVFNSVGEYYTLEGAKQLFESSGAFMRRVANGCLKGEEGHPKRAQGQSMDDYINRILTIDEKNVCCHFKDVWLDEAFGKKNPEFKNPDLVAIMANVKPAGPMGPSLQASLDNPHENVCFSIRALTKDFYQRGQTFRVLTSIVGWDHVTEPGLSLANKWDSPGLENMEEHLITRRQLETVAYSKEFAVATEESKAIALESLKAYDSAIPQIKMPIYGKW